LLARGVRSWPEVGTDRATSESPTLYGHHEGLRVARGL